jgi:hypothetical protein
MQMLHLAILAIVLALRVGQSSSVTVRRVPPEAFPPCIGAQPIYGPLGIVEKEGKQRTNLTSAEVGEYVTRRLKQGYKVTLYPQISGQIFAIAECPTDAQE